MKTGWSFKCLENSGIPTKTKPIEAIFPKELKNKENKNKSNEIKKLQGKFDRSHLKYETNKCIYDFQQPQTIISFDDFNGKFTTGEADKKQAIYYKVF